MNPNLAKLGDEYWEWLLRTEPTEATYLGDMRYNDRMPSIGAEGRARQLGELRGLLRRVDALAAAPGPLDEEEALTLDILGQTIRDQIDERSHHFEQWWVDQLRGPQVWLQELLTYQPQKTEQDFADLAARYRAVGPYLDEYLENLREGVRDGRTAPAIAVARVAGQIRDMLAVPVEASPMTPSRDGLESPRRAALQAEVEAALREVVYPGFQRVGAFLDGGYPARGAVGLCALPGGDQAYAFRIRSMTTTDLSARAIHDEGLRMMADVHREMEAIARALGHEGSLASLRAAIQADPANFPPSREALLDGFRDLLAEAQAALPRWFGRLPRVRCEVKAIETFRERDCVAAYYYPPPDDFSRPGYFYANTYEPEKRPRYNMAALTVHEAVPGHHLQIALALEQSALPAFRRHCSFTAFIEGWALYTERLSVEMGLYPDRLSLFGMLTFQAWRIGRLVVDTGMHALGWTRQQAIDYLLENVGLPEPEILNEVDRYIIWPGQALAYAVGMREIQRLRGEAEAALGTDFDIRAFHDEILRHGALPLTTLRRVTERYRERAQAARTA